MGHSSLPISYHWKLAASRSLQTINLTFMDIDHNKHTSLQHNSHARRWRSNRVVSRGFYYGVSGI
ncbi:hypothetical protein TSUD_260950 [Trifolium subterraneum]|uniref:Uncharacterized protein n=1 Tax=Trifolium subterraneum TaxID=3900 RepID=A0A2Z6MGV4_TRISU|nr:hypothetical protein TSUD_260950 [Trifolium subterraneum]